MTTATMDDGDQLEVEIKGEGPFLLLPVSPTPMEGEAAEEMRRWGADPALGRNLIEGLQDTVTVVAFDYEGHVLAAPKPDTLTPANVAADMLGVADAAGDNFAYYGYSWLALSGMQLAIRTDRLTALVMGGFPPRWAVCEDAGGDGCHPSDGFETWPHTANNRPPGRTRRLVGRRIRYARTPGSTVPHVVRESPRLR